MEVRLIKAKEEDKELLIGYELGTLDDPEKYRDWVENDVDESLQDTRIITTNGEKIGMITAYPVDDYWYVGEIYLIPEFRGKGIGRAIMQSEIDKHKDLLLRVSKENTRALELYKSLGFEFTYEYEPVEDLYYMTNAQKSE